jgi:hypothetical protein
MERVVSSRLRKETVVPFDMMGGPRVGQEVVEI